MSLLVSVHRFRRARRLISATLALILSVSVLAVVASSPAAAVNTAREALVDHDRDAGTAQVREFAGADRYATSLAVARGFVRASGGFIDAVVIASGESLVDASAAAGLAAAKGAPVLLTPRDTLQEALVSFIDESFISDVFIVGGTSAVSADVETQLDALPSVSSVKRLAGADRYETSVTVAEELGEPGLYCSEGQTAAVLVNVDSSFADIVAVGPLAYGLNLPVLLTAANTLPNTVNSYLIDADIERLVVVGGTAAVSAAVTEDAQAAGVNDIMRIAGANRFETAVEILNAIAACPTLTLSPTSVALINGDAAADGVSAGPLLGTGLGSGTGITPALLVNAASLPAETREYLASTPTADAAGNLRNLTITAIGGETVIPAAVMNAALEAATTSTSITAAFIFTPPASATGSQTILLRFSEPVNFAAVEIVGARSPLWTTSALNPANYRVSGGALLAGDSVAAVGSGNQIVSLVLNDRLANGDTVELLAGRVSGLSADGRRSRGATLTVNTGADNAGPRVSVVIAERGHEIRVIATDTRLVSGTGLEEFDLAGVTIEGEPLPLISRELSYSVPAGTLVTAAGTDGPTVNSAGETTAAIPIRHQDLSQADRSQLPTTSRTFLAQFRSDAPTFNGEYVICLFGRSDAAIDSDCRTEAPMPPPEPAATTYEVSTLVENPGDIAGTNTRAGTTYSSFVPTETETPASREYLDSTVRRRLQGGDEVIIAQNTIADAAGNGNRSARASLGSRTTSGTPEVRRASVTRPVPYDANGPAPGGARNAAWEWSFIAPLLEAPPSRPAFLPPLPNLSERYDIFLPISLLRLEARPDGSAAGAAGNAWSLLWQVRPEAQDPDTSNAEVLVDVLDTRNIIRVTFDEGATIVAAVRALRSNAAVAANFTVRSDVLDKTGPPEGDADVFQVAAERYIRSLPLSLGEDECTQRTGTFADGDTHDCGLNLNRSVVLDYPGRRTTSPGPGQPQVPVADVVGAELGQPTSTRRNFVGGQSAVRVTLTYSEVLESFDYDALVATNQGTENYPATAGWGTPDRITSTSTISFQLFSADLRQLPTSADTINLPEGVATSFAADNSASEPDTNLALRAG